MPKCSVNILSVPSLASASVTPLTASTTVAAETSVSSGTVTNTTRLLSLPPKARFESFEELKSAAQAHALAAGYAFVIGKGDTKKGRKIRHLDCKRAGVYRGIGAPKPEYRVRDRKSVKSECPV